MILAADTSQHPWFAVGILLTVAIGQSVMAYAFWRERGPRSWYTNYVVRSLGKGALVLAVFFYSLALFGSMVTIHRNHTTGTGSALWMAASVVTGVAWGLSVLLAIVMWFTGRPQGLVPPVFRDPKEPN